MTKVSKVYFGFSRAGSTSRPRTAGRLKSSTEAPPDPPPSGVRSRPVPGRARLAPSGPSEPSGGFRSRVDRRSGGSGLDGHGDRTWRP